MPAVKTFALYAAVAVFIDFILQITAFIALMTIDQKRSESGRLDLFCCFTSQVKVTKDASHGLLQTGFEKFYTPFLLSK